MNGRKPERPNTPSLPSKDKTFRRQNPTPATPDVAAQTKAKEEAIANRTAREK